MEMSETQAKAHTEKDASYRFLLEQYLASENLEIRPFLEIGNTEFIVRLLKEGQGISFLPEFTVRPDIDRGLLARVHVPAFHMNIWKQIVYHKDKWVSREMGGVFGVGGEDGRDGEEGLDVLFPPLGQVGGRIADHILKQLLPFPEAYAPPHQRIAHKCTVGLLEVTI